MVRLAVLSVLVLGSAAADSVYFTNPRLVRPIDHSSASSIFNLRGGDTSFEIHDVAESDEEDAVGTAKTVLCLSAPLWLKMQDIPVRYLASRHQDTKTSRLQDIRVEAPHHGTTQGVTIGPKRPRSECARLGVVFSVQRIG